MDDFYREVERVLLPGGVLAVAGYHFTGPAPTTPFSQQLAAALTRLYTATAPYWSYRRAHVDSAYTSLPAPALLTDMERNDDDHFVDIDASFEDWVS